MTSLTTAARRHLPTLDALEPRRMLAVSLSPNTSVGTVNGRVAFTDSLSSTNKQDVRKLTLSPGGSLKVVVWGLSGNADIQLIKDANNNLAVDTGETLVTSANTGTTNETITKSGLAAGTYYVRVFESGTSAINYQVSLKADYAGNTLGVARNVGTLSTSTTLKDWAGSDDTSDFYKFGLSASKPFTASLGGLAANLDLQLIQDKNSNGIVDTGETLATSAKTGTSGETIIKTLAAGSYFVRVVRPGTGGGDSNYTLTLKVTAPPPPAHLNIKFDYSLDASGFFTAHPTAKDRLNDAAKTFSILTDNLSAITPGGTNTWSAVFNNPGAGGGPEVTRNNLSIAANTIVVYVGGRSDLSGLELGEGGPGGWSASGSQSWIDTIRARGQAGARANPPTDFALWGGAITFSSNTNWNFSASNPTSGQNDFLSVAIHELGHVFGIGTADSWHAKISAGKFTGGNARTANGGVNPSVSGDQGHFAQGTRSTVGGVSQELVMVPALTTGTRRRFTKLDYAALADIGWQVPAGAGAAAAATAPAPAPRAASLLFSQRDLQIGHVDDVWQYADA